MDIELQISQTTMGDRARYDLKVGEKIYHFWSGPEVQRFANAKNHFDDDLTERVRMIIKRELQTRTPAEILAFRNKRTFTFTDPQITLKNDGI